MTNMLQNSMIGCVRSFQATVINPELAPIRPDNPGVADVWQDWHLPALIQKLGMRIAVRPDNFAGLQPSGDKAVRGFSSFADTTERAEKSVNRFAGMDEGEKHAFKRLMAGWHPGIERKFANPALDCQGLQVAYQCDTVIRHPAVKKVGAAKLKSKILTDARTSQTKPVGICI